MEASAQVTVPGRRLGKLPPKYDARTLRLTDFVARKTIARQAPKTFDGLRSKWGRALTFPMFGNDQYGDCTCAARGHDEIVTSRGSETTTEAKVLALYSRVTGFDPKTGAHDDGAMLLDVLNASQKPEYELAPEPIGPFAAVDPKDDEMVRLAIWLFGGLYAGYALPITAQTQDRTWTDLGNVNGSEPWSWGGHAVKHLPWYTAKQTKLVTWASTRFVTESFRDRYNDELFAVLDVDWLDTAHGGKVHGFDRAGLEAAVKELHR